MGRGGEFRDGPGRVPEKLRQFDGRPAIGCEPVEERRGTVVKFHREFAEGHPLGEVFAAVREIDHTVGREKAVDGKVDRIFEFGMIVEVDLPAGEPPECVGEGKGCTDAVIPVSRTLFPGAVVLNGVVEFRDAFDALPNNAEHGFARVNSRPKMDVLCVEQGQGAQAHVGDAHGTPVAVVSRRPEVVLHAPDAMAQSAREDHEFELAALIFGKRIVEQVVRGRETGTGMAAVQIQKHEFVDRVDPRRPAHD